MNARRSLLILAASLLVSACGFKLRGFYEVPPALQQLVLVEQSAVPTALGRELISQMEISGVQISESAPYRLQLGVARYHRRALTLSSRAEANEYELSGEVSFSLFRQDAETPELERTVSMVRSYSNLDNGGTLGELKLESIEGRYRDEINQGLAEQIMRQYLGYVPGD